MKPFLTALLLVLVVGGGTHWVLWRWAVHAFPRIVRFRRVLLGTTLGLFLLLPITRALVTARHSEGAAYVQVALVAELATVAIASIPIGALHLLSLATSGRRGGRRPPTVSEAERSAPPSEPDAGRDDVITEPSKRVRAETSRRQLLEGAGGLAILGSTASVLGWGIVRGRHAFTVEEVVVRIPGLPRALEGYTIAQVSDIHVGAFVGERELAEGFDRIREIRPDMVVATGDLVDFDPSYAPVVARALADLRAFARDGVYAIPGNHDHYAGARRIVTALEAAGVVPLVNAGRQVRPADGGGFALLGVDDLAAGHRRRLGPNLARAAAMVPSDVPRILLSHQPSTIRFWAGEVALQLSGHTHGGQINPGFVPARAIMPYVAGRYDVNGTALYVNRGFGTAGPPIRVGAAPEVTKVVLVAG